MTASGTERVRTGLKALKARVKVRGLAAIDRRTAAARALIAWRQQLVSDLGGDAHLTAAQKALVEAAVRTRLYVDHVDAHLLELPSLVTRRGRLRPLVEQRQRLVDGLLRLLMALGLERKPRPVMDLTQYLETRYAQRAGEPSEP